MNAKVDRASSNIRVFVVDDDEFFLKRIEHLCASNGMAVTAFSDTRQIFSVLDQADPDVILLDLNMPDLNGFNVCKEVRSMPKWQHTPIVVVTAETFPVIETASLQLGATKFVTKPINGKELIDTIHSLVPPRPFVANDC
jgi:two-component system alkaline phosphatase synthesis response regulator PhoP